MIGTRSHPGAPGSTWRRLVAAWNGFWFSEGPATALGLFRVLFAYCLWREVDTTQTKAVFAMQSDGFHMPYLPGVGSLSPEAFELIHDIQYVLIPFLGLGVLTRVSALTLVGLQSYILWSDYLNFRNHPYFFILVLLLIAFSPARDAFSVRSLRAWALQGKPFLSSLVGPDRPLTFQRLIQLQVSIVYFFAALHKLHPMYLRGEILGSLLEDDLVEGTSGDVLGGMFGEEALAGFVGMSWPMIAASWFTVASEFFLAFALWFRRTRPFAILLGLALHGGIAFTMNIKTFSLATAATYLLFIEPETLPRLLGQRSRRVRAATALLCIGATGFATTVAAAGPLPEAWVTPAERSGFRATPANEATLEFLERLDRESDSIALASFGRSAEGRDLALVIAGRTGATTPAAARAAGVPVVLIQNGIHAGEIDGKDASLMLLRDLALGRRGAAWLERMVLLVIPIYNVDGHERISPHNRPNQDGPVEGMGFRTTTDGHDLNRDHLKLDTPEARALVRLVHDWRPHLHVDNHVTDGSDHAWVLTHSWVEPPRAPAAVGEWLASHMPRVVEATRAAGHPTGPYVSLLADSDPAAGFDSRVEGPRYATGYWPLLNRPSILVENHAYAPYEARVRANLDFMAALLDEVAREPAALVRAVEQAERATVALGRPEAEPSELVLRWRPAAPERITWPVYAWRVEPSAVTGTPLLRYERGEVREIEVPWVRRSEPELVVPRPRGYLIPPGWPALERRLDDHALEVERLTRPATLTVETLRIAHDPRAPTPAGSYQGRTAWPFVVERRTERVSVPAGTRWIPAEQPDFELAAQLLEPEAEDSLVAWGELAIAGERKEWIEPRVLEELAAAMLRDDPALAAAWRAALEDEAFAADPRARFEWWYRRTPFWDERRGLLPIYRVMEPPQLTTR